MSDYEYYGNLTNEELLGLVDEHYYSIGATGAQALETLRDDFRIWESHHGVPQARMEIVLGWFEQSLTERNLLDVMAGVNPERKFDRKPRATRIARIVRIVRRARGG